MTLLPLRCFLGLTYVFAGAQKLADRHFLDGRAATSLHAQMLFVGPTSPVHALVAVAARHAFGVGAVIAIGEIAVGLGTLAGLWTRYAAAGGLGLAAAFLLTVSWHIHPYFEGADIVFVFAWTPLLLGGCGPLGLDTWRTAATAADPEPEPSAPLLSRRDVVIGLMQTAGLAAAGVWISGVARVAGRPQATSTRRAASTSAGAPPRPVFGSPASPGPTASTQAPAPQRAQSTTTTQTPTPSEPSTTSRPSVSSQPEPQTTTRPAPATTTTAPPSPTTVPATTRGTSIGPASNVPVGGAESFSDPASGEPANVVQPQSGQFVAFSAVCTHAGCTVRFKKATSLQGTSLEFDCPCHSARFDATTGQPISGPASRPLRSISVYEGGDGNLYVDG